MKTLYTTYNNFAKRLVISLMVLMTVGVGTVFADTYTWTLASGDLGGQTSPASSVKKGSPAITWNTTYTWGTSSKYLGWDGNNTKKGVQIGSGSAYCTKAVFSTSDISGTITNITVNGSHASSGGASIVIKVGGETVKSSTNFTTTATDYSTGTISKSGQIEITISNSKEKAFYLKSISITYTPAPSGYAVTYNNGGRGTAPKNTTASSVTLSEITATGYTNTGWKANVDVKNGSNTIKAEELISNGTTVTLSQATTFTAQWTPKQVTITWNANGGIVTPSTSNYIYDGSSVTLPTPTRDGYNFKGWYTSGGTQITDIGTNNKPASDVTYYAQWTEKKLTNYRTSCADPCEQLGDATGLSVQTDYVDNGQTYVKFSWTPANNTKDHATKQVICIGKVGEEKKCTDLEGNQVWSGDLRSKLTPGEYEWTIQAIGDGETYCDGEVISGPNFTIEEPLTDNCRWVEIALEDITPEDEIVVTMGDNKTVYALGTDKIKNSPKSQAITITSGMIDINQDFDYSKYTWSISEVTGGYQLQSYGTTQYLYGVDSYITISSNPTTFSIFEDSENGNKCFAYLINYKAYFLGHGTEDGQTAWKRFESSDALKSNTLKFYKKICLPADEYWINYNLSNVTCTTGEKPNNISDEDLMLEFSANDGYKLPESISVSIGNNILPVDNEVYIWDSENGELFISAAQVTDNITITIEGCEQLAAPENLLATNITSTSAVLSWDAVAKADEYIVFVTDGETNLEIPTTNCTITIEGLSKNTYYLWDVTATADNYCDSKKPSVLTNEFTTLDVYTVTFNSNGGTAVEPQTVEHGGKATKPANPTKTGYTFAGWYTEADTEFDFNTPITSANPTLYARWNANQYTITFLKQYGSGGTDKATVTFNSNNFSVVTIEVPTRDGYEFGGYYTETGGAGLQIVDAEGKWLKNKTGYLDASGNWIKAESVNLYAKWTKIHTITWVVNNNTETPHHTSTALDGSTIDALPMPPADDLFEDCEVNAFVGWSTDNIGLEPDPTAPTDLFKTIAEAQSKIGAINGDKKFYAVYASEVEQIATFEADGLNGLSANSTLKWTHDNSGISLAISAGQRYTGSPKTFTITDGTSNYCEIVAPEGKSLKKAVVSITESKYKVNSVSSPWSLSTSNTTQTITTSTNATDLKMYATSSYQIRITQVDVTYTTYSNYITRCTALPDPVWGGATIDKTEIAVNCGETSSTDGAAKISFLKETNFNLYKDITVEVTSGNFIIASSRDGEYSTSVTLTPTQSGTNVGTLDGKYVYVRAVAPAMSDEDFTGTITISGKQLAQDQVIEVTAEVSCTQYTLTFNDQGQTKTVEGFAGTSVVAPEPWAGICTEPIQYVFDGWAETPVDNGTEEYEKINFSTYTMPSNNTTVLYAVYRYAEEGGEPVDGFVKVTEALSDWTGDYVIVDDEYNVAIKNAYKENTNSNKTLAIEEVTIESEKVVSPSANVIWALDKNGENYTMYNEVIKKYAGVSGSGTEKAILSADKHDIQIIFDSKTKIAKVYSVSASRCFEYYVANEEWRTYSSTDARYNTGYLYRFSEKTLRYTSSLVCGEISVEEDNVVVTSTKDQKVKVNVPIKVSSYYNDVVNVTGVGESTFSVAAIENVAVNTDETVNLELTYSPSEYDHLDNETITLTASNGATTTFQVKGRSLPEKFAVVAKVGNNWFALPSQGLNSETTPIGYPIAVDNNEEPTEVTSLPTTAEWSLRNVHKVNGSTDRFVRNGENLVFINAENKTLYANTSNANIQTYANYSNYAETHPERYEWVPTTEDLTTYTLKNVGRDKNLSINVNTTFGTHTTNIATSNLRFLPIETTYTPIDMKVVEWYPTKVLVQTETTLASVSVMVGNEVVSNPIVTPVDAKLYEISGLPLKENPTKLLTIKYGELACNKVIPIILSQEEITVADALFSTLTTSVYNYSDLVVRDGAKLTINGIEKTPDKFVNVTIYPTAKIVVPENTQLNVYSLTFIGGITEVYDGSNYTLNKYAVPELSLKGKLGKTVTTMDYVMRVNLDQMYSLALPYDVALEDITYGDGSDIALGSALYVSAYDGAARAQNLGANNNWVYETDFATKFGSATLKAGVGYTISAQPQTSGDNYAILRLPMKSNIASGNTEAAKSVAVTAHGAGAAIADNHKGWNLVANPYMASISGDSDEYSELMLRYMEILPGGTWQWTGEEQRYVTIPYNDGSGYYQLKFSEAVLQPFKNFFVQVGTTGNLDFVLAHRQNAPARYMQTNTEREVEFEIILGNSLHQDNAGMLISDKYTPAYEINADLEKMTGSMSLYTIYNGYKLAYNATSLNEAEEWIPVGYIVPKVGEYTFKLDERAAVEDIIHIYLMDNETGVITDLIDNTYTFETSVKKNENRFAIRVVLSQEESGTTTGVDDLLQQDKQAQKFIYNDQLFILRDGVVYDAMGQRITTINK